MEKLIIEFYGMPGIGKTTKLKQLLKTQNNCLTNLDFLFLNKRRYYRYFLYLIVILRYFKIVYLYIKLIIQNNSSNKKEDLKAIFSVFKILAIYYLYYSSNKYKNNKFLYMDQGLIQIIFSILINSNNINSKKNIQNIQSIIDNIENTFNISFQYFDINDIKQYKKQLLGRKTNFSRFDYIKKDKNKLGKYIIKGVQIFNLIKKTLS